MTGEDLTEMQEGRHIAALCEPIEDATATRNELDEYLTVPVHAPPADPATDITAGSFAGKSTQP